MRQRIGGAEGQNCQSNLRSGQALDDIVNRAVAAARENSVAPRSHSDARMQRRFFTRVAGREFRFDTGGLDDADRSLQLGGTPAASRVGIK